MDLSTIKKHAAGDRFPLIYNCMTYAKCYDTSIGYIIGYQEIPQRELDRYDRLIEIFLDIMQFDSDRQAKLFDIFEQMIRNHPCYKNADTIGKRLYLERKQRNLTQQQVCQGSCYVSRISKYENMNGLNREGGNCIKIEHLIMLCQKYDVSVDYIINGIHDSYFSSFHGNKNCMCILDLLKDCSGDVQEDIIAKFIDILSS